MNFAVGRARRMSQDAAANDIAQVAELRSTSTSSRLDNALTTDEPTPCGHLSRCRTGAELAPRMQLGEDHLHPDRPVRGSVSTGIPAMIAQYRPGAM